VFQGSPNLVDFLMETVGMGSLKRTFFFFIEFARKAGWGEKDLWIFLAIISCMLKGH
jgi:hypothetical protein